MSEQYVAELRIFSFGITPRGWAQCNGQTLSIQQNAALFSIIGTFYGGNGSTTFQLPNLQGRVPIHTGGAVGAVIGQSAGEASHTLIMAEMPQHSHPPNASTTNNANNPAGNYPGTPTVGTDLFYGPTQNSNMSTLAVGNFGGNLPHPNMAPYLALNICIALSGIFPSRN
jgi:microcystin-dependent protein